MIRSARDSFNQAFSAEKYEAFLADLHAVHPGELEFRVAETPVFVSRDFSTKMLAACENIVDIITDPSFKVKTEKAIPPDLFVPNENDHPHFIAFDFGICEDGSGGYEPQLIEMQGFPSLFAYEVLLDDVFRRNFNLQPGLDCYLGNFNRQSYIDLLREIIVADGEPENAILLELFPKKQKTRIDFFCTQDYLGIPIVCLTELVKEGKQLFYQQNGKKTRAKRIYNRIIFDDLLQQSAEVQEMGKILFEDLDAEWVTHPHWFYRISKFTLPMIRNPYVPKTYYLSDIKQLPADLENYVLKPLFSFAGQGVVIDVKKEDIDGVNDPENWILQRKVKYADVIKTPSDPAKAEIRIFYFWKDGEVRPVATNNLARLSKGKMIGVRYNKDKEWVGGSFCYFEK